MRVLTRWAARSVSALLVVAPVNSPPAQSDGATSVCELWTSEFVGRSAKESVIRDTTRAYFSRFSAAQVDRIDCTVKRATRDTLINQIDVACRRTPAWAADFKAGFDLGAAVWAAYLDCVIKK